MRLHIMSDLHLDTRSTKHQFNQLLGRFRKTEPDYLILAGDIMGDVTQIAAIEDKIKPKQTVRICGNHEYYGTGHAHYVHEMWKDDNIAAATLWFPQDRDPSERQFMSDFKYLTPQWCFDRHKMHMEFLHENLRPIIVTHHLPSYECVDPRWRNSKLNAYFVGGNALWELEPKLWIHGHTHTAGDRMLGRTRVVCNPLGYPGEPNDFNPNLVIEL